MCCVNSAFISGASGVVWLFQAQWYRTLGGSETSSQNIVTMFSTTGTCYDVSWQRLCWSLQSTISVPSLLENTIWLSCRGWPLPMALKVFHQSCSLSTKVYRLKIWPTLSAVQLSIVSGWTGTHLPCHILTGTRARALLMINASAHPHRSSFVPRAKKPANL